MVTNYSTWRLPEKIETGKEWVEKGRPVKSEIPKKRLLHPLLLTPPGHGQHNWDQDVAVPAQEGRHQRVSARLPGTSHELVSVQLQPGIFLTPLAGTPPPAGQFWSGQYYQAGAG